jgi:polar amino acid transport system substrate-binding protein
MEALERYELDLLLGGLTKESPWKTDVGLTSPYFENRIVVATRGPGEKIKGIQVAVESGDVAAAYLEKKGAVPVRVERLRDASTEAIAGPEWEVQQLGFNQIVEQLMSEKHVVAAPPGENAWIKKLDEFLHSRRNEIIDRLKKENAAP